MWRSGMLFNAITVLAFVVSVICGQNVDVTANTTLSCGYKATCSAGGYEGACVSVSAGCCNSGTITVNLCPGDSDIRCCTAHTCSTPSGSGTCMSTSQCSGKGGHSVAGYCAGPADLQCCLGGPGPTPSGDISRDEIISRAQNWVNRRIPYSQTEYTDGYRQDCSGMVSMAWKTSTAGGGHTTRNMLDICHKISRSELKRGDALLKPGEHVLLFDKWVDSDHFMEYAEHTYGQVASHDQTSYSLRAGLGYFPCRYNKVA